MNEMCITHHVRTSTGIPIGTIVMSEMNGDILVAFSRVRLSKDVFSKKVGTHTALSRLHKFGMTFDKKTLVVNGSVTSDSLYKDKDQRAYVYSFMSKRVFIDIVNMIDRATKYFKIESDAVTLYIKSGKNIIKYIDSPTAKKLRSIAKYGTDDKWVAVDANTMVKNTTK